MNKTALITGASGGIGLELAKEHAKYGGDLVLVARSKEKLEQIKQEIEKNFSVSVKIIVKDLSHPNSAQEVYDEIVKSNIIIDYLINNAGFGTYGLFMDSDLQKQEEMINLNILTLVKLTRLFLPLMLERQFGKIMNVASTAAFQPGPTMAVYYASKAFVLHFSEALSNELIGKGITVTAFCPGATQSGFQEAAAMQESRLVRGRKLSSSAEIAQSGYSAMLKGKVVAIPGLLNKFGAWSVRFAPRGLVVKLVRFIQDK